MRPPDLQGPRGHIDQAARAPLHGTSLEGLPGCPRVRGLAPSLVLLLALVAGCADPVPAPVADPHMDPAGPATTATALDTGANVTFHAPVPIDAERPGGEPVLFVTPQGNLLVAAHPGPTHSSPTAGGPDTGLLTSFTAQNMMWRSTDGGTSWDYVGFPGVGLGPRDTSLSISDPDLTADAAGNIYHVSLYNPGEAQVGLGMAVSSDDGVTWTASPLEPGGDRPWISARGEHDVFVAVHGSIYRSVPASQGIRLQNVGHSPYSQPDTNLQVGPDGHLYHGGYTGIARSMDDGATWSELDDNMTDATSEGWQMAEPVFDAAGNLYATWFVGPDVHYGVWAPDGSWIGERKVASLPGAHLWPWMVAGAEGRIAIVWLGSLEATGSDSNVGWHVYAAFVTEAHTEAPQWSVVDATPDPIHNGVLCQSGVGCAGASDRRLGDFFTAAVLPDGRLGIAVASTTVGAEGATDGWWGRPVFVAQDGGPRLR